MLISPSPSRAPAPAPRKQALATCICLSAMAVLLAGCSAPVLPQPTPAAHEVPFLGKQLTQQQIAEWREKVASQRNQLQATLLEQKKACYQQFFTNACLQSSQRSYRTQEAVLRKQEIELTPRPRAQRNRQTIALARKSQRRTLAAPHNSSAQQRHRQRAPCLHQSACCKSIAGFYCCGVASNANNAKKPTTSIYAPYRPKMPGMAHKYWLCCLAC